MATCEKMRCLLRPLLIVVLFHVAYAQNNIGYYKVDLSSPKQVIWGIGVELQSDSIASGNNGLPDEVSGVPYDLVDSEKMRFYTDLLSGFRYLRLAMGLYLRGTDESKKHIVGRYDEQMKQLADLVNYSGIEGVAIEYWSPAPYWKSNKQYIGGSLASFNESFLSEFGDALVDDINYLLDNNVPVKMWGLQNEPPVGPGGCYYSCCGYSSQQYYTAFKAIGPKIKKNFPDMFIHVDSWGGQADSTAILNDPDLLAYVDGWSWHEIGSSSDLMINSQAYFTSNTKGKPVFSNEFEYQGNTCDWCCINTAQNLMNWLVFENSPTWYWLHALKPTTNAESSGYGLGFWRPWNDNNTSHFPDIQKGYWDYNYNNYNALAGFLKYMPWDSQRYDVIEDAIRFDYRILAFKTPADQDEKLVVVITNRATSPFTFNITVPLSEGTVFDGHVYSPSKTDASIGPQTLGATKYFASVVEPLSIQFWKQR